MNRLATPVLTTLFCALAASALAAAEPRLRFEETADGGVYVAGRLMPDTRITATEMSSLAGGPVLRFVGTRRDASLVGEEALPGLSHDLRHATSSARARDLHHYAKLRVRDAWPGIDIVHREGGGALEHDFVVAPGADASRIRMTFRGASELGVLEAGTLVARGADGELRLKAPVAWQEGAAGREPVACAWRVRGGRATFALGEHDATRELIIDPEIAWSTYMGGPNNTIVTWLAANPDGSVLVQMSGSEIPTTPGAYSAYTTSPQAQAAIAKLSSDGTTILWASYVPAFNYKASMRLPDGSVLVAGDTTFAFPVVGGLRSVGGSDGYVAILAADGASLVASGYFGGSEADHIWAAARAPNGDYVFGGTTQGDAFQADVTLGSAGNDPAGSYDCLILRVSGDLATILRSVRIGTTGDDSVFGLAMMPDDGGVVACFDTYSPDFPTVNAFLPSPPAHDCPGPARDAVVARLTPELDELVFSTYLAGRCEDVAQDIIVDAAGEIVVAGRTSSIDFPVADAWQAALAAGDDLFLTRLSPTGDLVFSTFLGGAANDFATRLSLDDAGRVLVAGSTKSSGFPRMAARGLPDDAPADPAGHAVLVRFDIDGGVEFSTTLGGLSPISQRALMPYSVGDAVASRGDDLLVGGMTMMSDFPTTQGAAAESAPADPSGIGVRGSGFVTVISGTISNLSEVSPVGAGNPGAPLIIREQGPMLVLGWEETNGGPQDDLARIVIYVGTLRSLQAGRYDHAPAAPCGFLVPPAEIEMPPGDVYFLVGRAKDDESSLGRDSFGRERPHPRVPCP